MNALTQTKTYQGGNWQTQFATSSTWMVLESVYINVRMINITSFALDGDVSQDLVGARMSVVIARRTYWVIHELTQSQAL